MTSTHPTTTPLVTLDVVLLLPPRLRERCVAASHLLAARLAADGTPSWFRLDEPFPGIGARGGCEPHVSLFMLAVETDQTGRVVDAVRALARSLPALPAVAREYRYNPFGAPELHYQPSAAWTALQRRVIAAVEPLREGRLRAVGPAGDRLADVVAGRSPGDPAARRQLLRYGYDEVTDGEDDRLRPHVTLCWPSDPAARVDLRGLPDPAVHSGVLDTIAVYAMSPYGTCTTAAGLAPLAGSGGPDRPGPPVSRSAVAGWAALGGGGADEDERTAERGEQPGQQPGPHGPAIRAEHPVVGAQGERGQATAPERTHQR